MKRFPYDSSVYNFSWIFKLLWKFSIMNDGLFRCGHCEVFGAWNVCWRIWMEVINNLKTIPPFLEWVKCKQLHFNQYFRTFKPWNFSRVGKINATFDRVTRKNEFEFFFQCFFVPLPSLNYISFLAQVYI